MKVLLVDDNKGFIETLKSFFENESCEVTTADSIDQAQKEIKKNEFNLIVLDILFPDKNSIDFLNECSPKDFKNAQIVLVSGVLGEDSIPENIKKAYLGKLDFIKKPLDKEALEGLMEDISQPTLTKFQIQEGSELSLEKYIQNKTFYGHDLLSIIFLARHASFEGELEIILPDKKTASIDFKSGNVIRIISKDSESLIGNLLVEYNFTVKEIFDGIDHSSHKQIGYQLIEQGHLSPHALHFILKQQAKIRLIKIFNSPSLELKVNQKSVKFDSKYDMDFNFSDLMELTFEYLEGFFSKKDLQDFYLKSKNLTIKFESKNFNEISHKLLEEYNAFHKQFQNTSLSLEELASQGDKNHITKMVYIGMTMKTLYLNSSLKTQNEEDKLKEQEMIIEKILKSKETDLFETLNLPWKSSPEEVEKAYKKLRKLCHPDKVSSVKHPELHAQSQDAFLKITKSYKTLSDVKKRAEYLKQEDEEKSFQLFSVYEQAVKAVNSKKYALAEDILSKIYKHPKAPSKAVLYYVWAQIKANPTKLKSKSVSQRILKQINEFPIQEKVSALAWFVNGIYYLHSEQPSKAGSFFKKALQVKKNFTEAKVEMLQAKRELKKQKILAKKSFFLNFFKKAS